MIVSKTPLRISFFGGGSDLPSFYNRKPGFVISTSIDRSIMIAVNKCETDHVRLSYSTFEQVNLAKDIKHDRVRHILAAFNIDSNIEITSFSDVPTKGTGLGSSSTFTVGLLKAILELKADRPYNKCDLAEAACQVELEYCGEKIGKQDQYAAAYGGFNAIEFHSDGVSISPINVGAERLQKLNDNLLLYNTGISRKAAELLQIQSKNVGKKGDAFESTSIMVDMAKLALIKLQKGDGSDFGAMLHEAWYLKKKLASGITTPAIDEMYEAGIKAGALGGKLLGAGGGGYMLFYVTPKDKHSVVMAMEKMNKRRLDFKFTDEGSKAWTI